ncbi:MAG: cation:proton antiporter [Actinomycetota bacterium]|nr:cation:proton antiporter [Actinomycetota bacterium]
MGDSEQFALLVLLASAVGIVAVLSSRLTARLKVPSPAIVLAGAAVAVEVVPGIHAPGHATVGRVVTVALVCVLFDGGMQIGWSRIRAAWRTVAVVGVLGTFLTAAAVAAIAHAVLGSGWYVAMLVATAVAPTDPAVVFSVLGRLQVPGRAGTIIAGESGANDPVGIALMASLVAAGGVGAGAFAHAAGEFLLQMAVGAAVGVAGGRSLVWFTRRVALPAEGLYPVRTLAGAMLVFGVASVAHGSGFLAVLLAGIALGDEPAPYKREIEAFHSALASLGEIVAFVVLGLTVRLADLVRPDVLLPGLAVAAALALVVRPAVVGPLLARSGLARNERAFVLFAGLKGAVPILLGGYLFDAHVHGATRDYSVVVVVVVLSVVVEGSLVPSVARALRLPVRGVHGAPRARR